MDAQYVSNYGSSQAQSIHAQLLQWLLNPLSSNFTRAHAQEIAWDQLLNYYLQADNKERLDVFIDYLCQNDYRQLRNHALVPLIHHRLIPMILTIINSEVQYVDLNHDEGTQKNHGYFAKQRLLIFLQLLARQPTLMKDFFHNSPKALVNTYKTISHWEKESVVISVFNSIITHMYDLTLTVYFQLPRKPAYRFATLELRTLLLKWFRVVSMIVNDATPEQYEHAQFIRSFKTVAERQQLLELIENRQLQALLHRDTKTECYQGMPQVEAEQACIMRSESGLIRLWS